MCAPNFMNAPMKSPYLEGSCGASTFGLIGSVDATLNLLHQFTAQFYDDLEVFREGLSLLSFDVVS